MTVTLFNKEQFAENRSVRGEVLPEIHINIVSKVVWLRGFGRRNLWQELHCIETRVCHVSLSRFRTYSQKRATFRSNHLQNGCSNFIQGSLTSRSWLAKIKLCACLHSPSEIKNQKIPQCIFAAACQTSLTLNWSFPKLGSDTLPGMVSIFRFPSSALKKLHPGKLQWQTSKNRISWGRGWMALKWAYCKKQERNLYSTVGSLCWSLKWNLTVDWCAQPSLFYVEILFKLFL